MADRLPVGVRIDATLGPTYGEAAGNYTQGQPFFPLLGTVITGIRYYSSITSITPTLRLGLWSPDGDNTGTLERTTDAAGVSVGWHTWVFPTPYIVPLAAFQDAYDTRGYYFWVTMYETTGSYYQTCYTGHIVGYTADCAWRQFQYGTYWGKAGDTFPSDGQVSLANVGIEPIGYGTGPKLVLPGVRVPGPAGYLDLVSSSAPGERLVLINTYPENNETNVKADTILRGTVASLDNVALATTTKLYVAINDAPAELVYDQGGTGFQAGWNGAGSSATVRQSPSSSVNDELVYAIDRTTDYPSEARVTVTADAETM